MKKYSPHSSGQPSKYNSSAWLKRIRKIPDDDEDEFSNEDYKTEVTLLKEVLKSPEEFEEILEFDHVISDDVFVKENAFYEMISHWNLKNLHDRRRCYYDISNRLLSEWNIWSPL